MLEKRKHVKNAFEIVGLFALFVLGRLSHHELHAVVGRETGHLDVDIICRLLTATVENERDGLMTELPDLRFRVVYEAQDLFIGCDRFVALPRFSLLAFEQAAKTYQTLY